jgi:N-glycosylase/DNA lyase
VGCVEAADTGCRLSIPVAGYDLDATLTSGQAFRWETLQGGWEGVIGSRWVRLTSGSGCILAETASPCGDADWLTGYLQSDANLEAIIASFPDDPAMRAAVRACRGLRLLRQDPWECLASFILSSSKQIAQIRQMVVALCQRYGDPVAVPAGHATGHRFPAPERLARVSEADLRACKMGFRAPYLQKTAEAVAGGAVDLGRIGTLTVDAAREQLLRLPGVGSKIANCVLLFAYGFQDAFPIDVWVMKALQRLYFRKRRVSLRRLREFAAGYFGTHSGYAQQYLFHYIRVHARSENR